VTNAEQIFTDSREKIVSVWGVKKLELDLGEGSNPLQNVVQQLIFESNLMVKLEATDIVINALDKKISNKTNSKEFQKFLHSLFDDNDFMRRLEYVSRIKDNIETSLEYTGMDYLSSEDFSYDVDFEKKLVAIKKRLQRFLGILLKEFSKGIELEL